MLRLLRPLFIKWLRERALVIPEAKRDEIAQRLNLSRSTVDRVLFALRDAILENVFGEGKS